MEDIRFEIKKEIENLLILDDCSSINIQDNSNLYDLGLTSLLFIKLVVNLENKFNIEFDDSDLLISNFGTFGNVCNTVERYIDKSSQKKVLVCDCDGVLWDGISGEEHLEINDKQKLLHKKLFQLFKNGVLLCICSSNSMINILNGLRQIPLIDENFFLKIITDSYDKSVSLTELAKEYNLKLNGFVFLDDSGFEIQRMKENLPDVTSIQIDTENIDLVLNQYFSKTSAMGEIRTQLYRQQKDREKTMNNFISVEDFNVKVNTVLTIESSSLEQAARIAELSQRTNKFNLANEKYSDLDICFYINSNNYDVYSLIASDDFGDMGLVGVAIVLIEYGKVIIKNMFVSCRVLGRKFESFFLERIKEIYFDKHIYSIYNHTIDNSNYSNFYERHSIHNYDKPKINSI